MISLEACVKKLSSPLGSIEKAEKWEVEIIRELANRHLALASSPENLKKIEHWKKFNALKSLESPFLIEYDHAAKELPSCMPPCKTVNLQPVEHYFNISHWHFTNVADSFVVHPWVSTKSKKFTVNGTWGIDVKSERNSITGGFRDINPSFSKDDVHKLTATPHKILDHNPPLAKYMREYIGDILPVHVNKSTAYRWWNGVDMSETLFHLFGYEGLMINMYDEPELIHEVMGILQKGIIKNLDEVKAAGDWAQTDMYNHAVVDTEGLPDPAPNNYTSNEKSMWFFMHAQEFDPIGPDLYEEFMFNYQLPIMERFGLISYGCCESLSNKMHLMRKIPNLRRICVGPTAKLKDSVSGIGSDYIVSWRPAIPLVTGAIDMDYAGKLLSNAVETAKGTHFEIVAKDIMGFSGDPSRVVQLSHAIKGALEKFR